MGVIINNAETLEEYARELYHYLKTEQTITFEKHKADPKIDGLMFDCERILGNQSIFHYSYVNENEELIRKKRRL